MTRKCDIYFVLNLIWNHFNSLKRKQILKLTVAENVMSFKLTWMNIPSILLPRLETLEVRIVTFSYPVKMKMKTTIDDVFISKPMLAMKNKMKIQIKWKLLYFITKMLKWNVWKHNREKAYSNWRAKSFSHSKDSNLQVGNWMAQQLLRISYQITLATF